MVNASNLLITGATGSLGRHFLKLVLKECPYLKKISIYSRDEFKQYELAKELPESVYPQLQYVLGDIRDRDKLILATQGIDIIVHIAALIHVPLGETNPDEFIKTNIGGSQNIADAARINNVRKVIVVSTDKAVSPVNLYGATKMIAEKIFLSAGQNNQKTKYTIIRFGNLFGARGSVIPLFREKAKEGNIPVTHPGMTRFTIPLTLAAKDILWIMKHALGNEVFIPRMPSYHIIDLAKAIAPTSTITYTGIRPGERLHEELISPAESENTIELEDFYAIIPINSNPEQYLQHYNAKKTPSGFSYSSNHNNVWLTEDQLTDMLSQL